MKTSRVVSVALRTTFSAIAFSALALFAVGCSNNGLNQDPYANQTDAVKNRVPPEKNTAPPTGKADSPSELRIDADDNLEFREGVPGTAKISGRLLREVNGHEPVLGQDFTISIDNLSDFPGANFDAPTGTLTWTPQAGFVQSNYTRNAHFNVTLTANLGIVRKTTKSVLAVVTRAEVDPTIVSVEDLNQPSAIHEGEQRVFKVVVRDPHGDDMTDMRPRLTVVASDPTQPSAAGYISLQRGMGTANPVRDPSDKTQWIFSLVLDLKNKEITTGKQGLNFGLIATSRFGETSAIKTSSVTVLTKLNDPLVSWSDQAPIDFVAGKANTTTFTVFDPRGEGNLTVNFSTRCDVTLGPNATCTCVAQTAPVAGIAAQICTISWTVPATQPAGNIPVQFQSFNQSKFDSQQLQTQFTRTIRVVAPSQPIPAFVPPAIAKPVSQNATNSSNNGGTH